MCVCARACVFQVFQPHLPVIFWLYPNTFGKKNVSLLGGYFTFFFLQLSGYFEKNMTTKCNNKVEYYMQNPRSDHPAHLHSLITVTVLLWQSLYSIWCAKLLSDWQTVRNLIRCSRMHIWSGSTQYAQACLSEHVKCRNFIKSNTLRNHQDPPMYVVDIFSLDTTKTKTLVGWWCGVVGGGGHFLSKRVGVCCQKPGTPPSPGGLPRRWGLPFPDTIETQL